AAVREAAAPPSAPPVRERDPERSRPSSRSLLNVRIQVELVRVRTERDFLRAGALDREPGLDEIFGEHVPAHEEVTIGVKRVEHFFERARCLLHTLLRLALDRVKAAAIGLCGAIRCI